MIRPRVRHTGRPCCLILLCLLLLPWLGACAPQYGVSVDSLRGPQADSAGTVSSYPMPFLSITTPESVVSVILPFI